MKRLVVMVLLAGVCASTLVAAGQAGIPLPKRWVICHADWSQPYFTGNTLTVRFTIKCNRQMKSLGGHAYLVRVKLSGVADQLGAPSTQASAHDEFYRVGVNAYAGQVSHFCTSSKDSYMWWFALRTRAAHPSWRTPQVKQFFSRTIITDCG